MKKQAWLAVLAAVSTAVLADITPTERGARIATDRFELEIRDGLVAGILNKLTGESYLDPHAALTNVALHLPGGLGTQATEPERASAETLYKWPWWEHDESALWPAHHAPSPASRVEFKAKDPNAAVLTYAGLTDGVKAYPDETLSLELAIDPETGDALITPVARSPRKGVFSSSLAVAPLGPAITAEAPIFDGVRLDRHMQPKLWVNQWGGYWDYAFLAFNGYRKGAVAVWCQDPELKYYKYLHYLVNREGISFSFTAFNIPPFDDLKEAGTATWRIQAFEKGWSQAAARFRDWRLKSVKIAPRPEWGKTVSFVNGGVNGSKQWVDMLEGYLGGSNLDRTVTFGATIRGEGFDQNHANNTPYAAFKEDMRYWKQKGPKMMAYLQPMIMWSPNPKTDREKAGVEAHKKADTISVFQKSPAKTLPYIDQHHLGQPEWQRWFLDWVKEYIQDYGADAVYHDQSYHCPVDVRGLAVAGKTSTMGMADYFYKAQAENPGSLHGTEHMTEVNGVGASLGIGSGILWGTAESMRRQRIDHPSPVCNALHYPNGALFSFPHYSQITSRLLQRIHWGMNISEGRGELAYAAVQSPDAAATRNLANERWMDLLRSRTFVHKGLRAEFPEDWDADVLSYFRGRNGESFRYQKTPWGTAFVEMRDGRATLLYGRIHGTPYARTEGAIYGWSFYNAEGPAGLNPARYYVLDPAGKRPAVHFSSNNAFSPSLYEGFVDEGFVADAFAYIRIKPREDLLNIITYDSVLLHAPEAPKAVFVNGTPVKPQAVTNGQWKIDFQLSDTVAIVALLKDPPEGFDKTAESAVGRLTGLDWAIDQFTAVSGTNGFKALTNGLACDRPRVLVPVRAPSGQGDGTLQVALKGRGVGSVEWNGMARPAQDSLSVKMKAGESALLSARAVEGGLTVTFGWEPAAVKAP